MASRTAVRARTGNAKPRSAQSQIFLRALRALRSNVVARYHTRHASRAPSARPPCTRTPSGTRACSTTTPLTRYAARASAGRSARACARPPGVAFWHQIWPQPRNSRCSGVKPSIVPRRLRRRPREVAPSARCAGRRCRPCSRRASACRSASPRRPRCRRRTGRRSTARAPRTPWRRPASTSPCRLPLRVELPPLIVEAVGQLVADHRADAAEVHRVVRPSRCRRAAAGCRPGS